MTAEAIRKMAEKMPHAIRRDRQYDHDGKFLAEQEHHYLTCRRCELERLAERTERGQ